MISLFSKNYHKKFKKGQIVKHWVTNSFGRIIKKATKEELEKEYPKFSWRPYEAYWVEFNNTNTKCLATSTLKEITND